MHARPMAGVLVAGGAIVIVAAAVFTQLHPGGTAAAGAPSAPSPTAPSSSGAGSAGASPGPVPPVANVPLPPPTPVAARTLARYRELTARAEQLVAAITPPNARREDVPLRGPSARTLPNGGLPDSLTNGIRYDSPATASRLWEVTTNSTAALSHWVATQHIPGATLAGSVDLKATDPSPSAGFSQQTITFAVAATASIPAGAVTVHVFHADATRSGMMVDALIPWTDPAPARVGPDPGEPRYVVHDGSTCPALPGLPTQPSGIAPSMPNFANSGYPTVTRLLPDLAPDAALRCHYPRRPDSVLSTTASATRTYSAAAARSLTGRLSAAPIGHCTPPSTT